MKAQRVTSLRDAWSERRSGSRRGIEFDESGVRGRIQHEDANHCCVRRARRRSDVTLFLIAAFAAFPASAFAQVFARPFQPTPAVIGELDAEGSRLLARAQKLAGESPPTDAVEALLQVIERHGTELVQAKNAEGGFEVYWPADRYAQELLREWGTEHPPAVSLYRQLVDRPLEEAIARARKNREVLPLRTALERFGGASSEASGWLLLGELHLEQGQYAEAQIAFEPAAEAAEGKQQRADAAARLAIAAMLAGDVEEAQRALAQLQKVDPDAEGKLAGKSGPWLKLLEDFQASLPKPAARDSKSSLDLAARSQWSLDLPRLAGDGDVLATGRQRVADDHRALLACYPLVVDDRVFLRQDAAGQTSIRAFEWKDGRESWRFDEELPLPEDKRPAATRELLSDAERTLPPHIGVTRYTIQFSGGAIFARMGSPLTAPAARRIDSVRAKDQGWLVGLDLAAQGRPLEGFPLYPTAGDWAFEGSPLADEGKIYVLQTRRDGTRRQLHVACFARLTTPVDTSGGNNDGRARGRMLWRTLIATADTVGGGDFDEVSHALLTRVDNLLCVNTNLGAVAAVDVDTGRIRWLTRYPRAPFSAAANVTTENHYFRDLAPPVVAGQRVIFAPQDCQRIFACDLGSGELLWTLPPERSNDVIHLLGVQGKYLVATGKDVLWIELATGKVAATYHPAAEALGRGLVLEDVVLWPTKTAIHVLPALGETPAPTVQPVRIIDLAQRGASGGNLAVAPDGLLIASGTKLWAFRRADDKSE
jgi:tetratricopeptide (TPR) repeat protein/outer membrane protein assembly factor BamB